MKKIVKTQLERLHTYQPEYTCIARALSRELLAAAGKNDYSGAIRFSNELKGILQERVGKDLA